MPELPRFLFITCQVGAEAGVKQELAHRWPTARLAYSRPGFLTFKLPEELSSAADFDLESVFARAYGFSLGKVQGNDPDQLARDAWQLFGRSAGPGCPAVRRIHAWPRDVAPPGEHGFEPGLTPAALEARAALLRHCPRSDRLAKDAAAKVAAEPGEMVLDCILVEPNEWWIGYHQAGRVASRWPGGMLGLELPPHAVSRAWLKMEEALRWSELPIAAGARCAEIGSAPGGASQALLDRGILVTGIDPAEMAAEVLQHPNFTHLRRRANQVRRRDFRKIRWLTADMNVAPRYTLDVVEEIVAHPQINIRGMLLTLKLFQWEMAQEVPQYVARIRAWGYNFVNIRQLQYNRQEICVAALQKPFRRKPISPEIS
jgi:23S rRNA (cytidine2498-2'-O)-methyltransferase